MKSILPLAGALAESWEEIVLAVNSTPSSNDMTRGEAEAILAALPARIALGRLRDSGRLRIVETGTGTPGIDLTGIGASVDGEVAGAEAIILEGQGRGVETTWSARFRLPAARLAVVKDPLVAEAAGLALMQPLLRRQPAAGEHDPSSSRGEESTRDGSGR
ncbi:MAG: hypothetical protein GF355_09135 [Candidatus Eisenbacteria bacterium]|nr:hypothetical protein [Candidatus Eisenbacteria bacterium]